MGWVTTTFMLIKNVRIPNSRHDSLRIREEELQETGVRLRPLDGEFELDAEGCLALPGFWDTHVHTLFWARMLKQLDLTGVRSREALLRAVREYAQSGKSEWVAGGGWSEALWEDTRWPTFDELDEAAQGLPLFLSRSDLHSALVNREALKRAGLNEHSPDPPGGRISDGAVYDLAMWPFEKLLPMLEGLALERAVAEAIGMLHAWGITGIVDQRIKDAPDLQESMQVFQRVKPRLRIHVNLAEQHLPMLEELALPFGWGDRWMRLGHVKFFSDGSLGSRTAKMREPYIGTANTGLWLTTPDELRRKFAWTHRLGYPVCVHAIGDEAVDTVLGIFEEVGTHPLDRIEHVQYLDKPWAHRIAKLGVTASVQPTHLLDDRRTSEDLVGERSRDYYRLNSLQDAGARLAFGSDAPVATPDPWLAIRAATKRQRASEPPWYPEECIDWDSAVRAYTEDAAASLGWNQTGRLDPGCWADLILVRDETVQLTMIGGEVVYQAP